MGTYVSGSHAINGLSATGNDTNFRLFVATVRAALSGCGLVQTSDTGQLNPATILRPTTNNTTTGYEIYRFNDSAQGTDPIFLRVDYGRGGFNSAYETRWSLGQGTNGAGTLTGQLSSAVGLANMNARGNSTTTSEVSVGTAQTYAYHGDGVFWIAYGMLATVTSYQFAPANFIHIARTRDADGDLDARGALMWGLAHGDSAGGNNTKFICWAAGEAITYPENSHYCLVAGDPASDLNEDGDRIAWPHFYYDAGEIKKHWAIWQMYRTGAPSTPTTFTAAPYGVSRLWIHWQTGPWAGQDVEGVSHLVNIDYTTGLVVLPWE